MVTIGASFYEWLRESEGTESAGKLLGDFTTSGLAGRSKFAEWIRKSGLEDQVRAALAEIDLPTPDREVLWLAAHGFGVAQINRLTKASLIPNSSDFVLWAPAMGPLADQQLTLDEEGRGIIRSLIAWGGDFEDPATPLVRKKPGSSEALSVRQIRYLTRGR